MQIFQKIIDVIFLGFFVFVCFAIYSLLISSIYNAEKPKDMIRPTVILVVLTALIGFAIMHDIHAIH